jgi:hypothetical protein
LFVVATTVIFIAAELGCSKNINLNFKALVTSNVKKKIKKLFFLQNKKNLF